MLLPFSTISWLVESEPPFVSLNVLSCDEPRLIFLVSVIVNPVVGVTLFPMVAPEKLDIATNLANHRHFIRYPQDLKYDLIGEGVERCCKGYKKFDPSYGTSPLAYFTQTCYNANRAFLGKEYKKINTVNQLIEDYQLDLIEELSEYN